MNANPNERPTAEELHEIVEFLYRSIIGTNEEEKFGYKRSEIKAAFEEADKEIPNISTSYEKNSDAIYTSRAFTFICDSQLIDLEVSNSIQLRDIDDESKVNDLVN
ncbi:unnamed protein product [Rhizophagus irregularis]|nr:unnamed protein product [Rhizophagus irregularis]